MHFLSNHRLLIEYDYCKQRKFSIYILDQSFLESIFQANFCKLLFRKNCCRGSFYQMPQIFFQATFWMLSLWIIYFKLCNFLFQTFFCNLMSSIIFCNFTNCSSRQIVCKLLWWIFCLQIVILDNFFLQIIDLNNFLLQIVIVIFFYKLSFQLYLSENCPSGQSFCNLPSCQSSCKLLFQTIFLSKFANCRFG